MESASIQTPSLADGVEGQAYLARLEAVGGSVSYYGFEVPEGTRRLTASITGGTGDADLYVRRGAHPLEYTYDCRPLRLGNEETCTFTSPGADEWYAMLRGFEAFTGVRLTVTLEP